MKKHLLFMALILGTFSFCRSQSLSPAVISSAGGVAETNSIILEWTLGESSVKTNSGTDNLYTEGFHQPLNVELATVNENLNLNYTVTVAPNPVKSILSISIQSVEEENIYITLTDVNGKAIAATQSVFKNDSKDVDMSLFEAGIYILHINNAKGDLIKTYKISKL
jgi:hypothetical protein